MAMNEIPERPSDADFEAVRLWVETDGYTKRSRRVFRYLFAEHDAKSALIAVPEDVRRDAELIINEEGSTNYEAHNVAFFVLELLPNLSPPAPETPKPSFVAGTGLAGATEPGQRVTRDNIAELPPGSVVRNSDGSRLIHLHDGLWLWCCDNSWCYDRIDNLKRRLDAKSVACHVAAGGTKGPASPSEPPKPVVEWRKSRNRESGNTRWELYVDDEYKAGVFRELRDDAPIWAATDFEGTNSYFPDLAAAKRRAEELAGVEAEPVPAPAEEKQPPTIEEAAAYVETLLRGNPWFVSVDVAGDKLNVYVTRTTRWPRVVPSEIAGWRIDVVLDRPVEKAVPAAVPIPAPSPAPPPVVTGPGVYLADEGHLERIGGRDEAGWYRQMPDGLKGSDRFGDDGHQRRGRTIRTIVRRIGDLSLWLGHDWTIYPGNDKVPQILAAAETASAPQPAPVVLPEPDEDGNFNWPDGSTVRSVWYAHDPTDRLIATTRDTAMDAAEALRAAGFGLGATTTGGAT